MTFITHIHAQFFLKQNEELNCKPSQNENFILVNEDLSPAEHSGQLGWLMRRDFSLNLRPKPSFFKAFPVIF